MEQPYAITTFCYGERYYNQTNRLIDSFVNFQDTPDIFVVTDNTDAIRKESFVKVKDIRDYNEKYSTYEKNYYGFDFSVKRFSLLFAFENGHENVILTDTDVVRNDYIFSTEKIMNTFVGNSIGGQVVYNFSNEVHTNSMLGRRLLHYEKKFGIEFEKSQLNEMPEDCIQFISIPHEKKFKFMETWDKCIKIKDSDNLHNVPAGNIDEMCFAALYNGIKCVNTSNKSVNLLIAKHEKWY